MSARAVLRQAEYRRIFRAAEKEGLSVRLETKPDGGLAILTIPREKAEPEAGSAPNEWDEVLPGA